ncbi:MAG: endo-1,4-beta-xylanase [Myxococcales bacterium]
MKREPTRRSTTRMLANSARRVSPLALLTAAFAVLGCSEGTESEGEVAQAAQSCAAQPPASDPSLAFSCGYAVEARHHSFWHWGGFFGSIELTNVSGDRGTEFEVFADLHGVTPRRCLRAECEAVEGGYLFTAPNRLQHAGIRRGHSYTIDFMSLDPSEDVTPYVVSINGVKCDQVAPTVSLEASGSFYTASGTLTLTATATDNVAVKKVVFLRDGQAIATDMTAPYVLDVPISTAENGRHRYTAAAYDMSGNTASTGTKSVLTSIGNKFFGTAITTAADYAGFSAHFNQITPGNAGKWGSVEAVQDQMNWTELDTAYNFAKSHNVPFKLHTLVWGQQQPTWMANLSADQQLAQIEEWMTALAARYPNVDLIDVVNEPLHAPPAYAAALGGAGATGWDWVIKSFEMARAHFPNAELLLNDYSILTMASTTQNYLKIINLLKERGLIDGIGEQGHFYERAPELSDLAANVQALADTGLPVYISELDLNFSDDARQAIRMRDVFSTFWSNPSVVGVTHWGYLQGNMWQTNAYLVRTDGSLRAALTWIECYKAGGTDCTVPTYVPQPRKGDNNGITLEAEDYDSAHALLPAGTVVGYTSDGSWLSFDSVAFDGNWDTLSLSYAKPGNVAVNLTVHLDSLDNAPVATLPLGSTADWSTYKTVTIPWAPIAGERKIFIRFNGGGGNIDTIKFSAPAGFSSNIITDSDFEQGTKDGWSTWATGAIANTTARAVSGTHGLIMSGRTGNSPLVQSLTSKVVPGKTYKASVWATIGGAASASAYVTTAIQCAGGSTTYGRLGGWSNSKTVADGTWLEFSGDIVVPDCPLANVAMWLEGPEANVDLYIDHVSVRQQTTQNVINNGTFESGTSGWSTWGGAVLSASTARFHGGAQSLLLSNRTSNSPALTDITSVVKPGTSYPFTLWVSINSPDGSSKAINVTQATTCVDASGTASTTYNWVGGPVTVANGASFTQIAGTVAVPNCTLKQLLFWVEGGAGSDLYVDDVQLLDNSGGSSNLIPDGTFEAGQGAWSGWNYGSLAVTSTAAHAGTYSLKGTSMAQYGALARDIKALVAPGKRYQATAWVSVGNLAAGSGSVKFQTTQSCNGVGSDSYPWLAGATVNNGAWQQVTGTVDLTACTSIEKLQLFVGTDSGDLYVDDVTLTPIP